VGLRSPLPDTTKLDRTPSAHWPGPQVTFTPGAADGPVLVTLTYDVPEPDAVAFADAMGHVGRSADARARCAGSCSATAATRPSSSSPTWSAPGRNTCANTRIG
jgi:hypothetical protein